MLISKQKKRTASGFRGQSLNRPFLKLLNMHHFDFQPKFLEFLVKWYPLNEAGLLLTFKFLLKTFKSKNGGHFQFKVLL